MLAEEPARVRLSTIGADEPAAARRASDESGPVVGDARHASAAATDGDGEVKIVWQGNQISRVVFPSGKTIEFRRG